MRYLITYLEVLDERIDNPDATSAGATPGGGPQQGELWLTPQGQARRDRLQQPTETLDEFIDRAIAALEVLERGQPVRPLPSEILGITSDTALPVTVRESILHEVRRVLTSDALWQEVLQPRLTQTLSQMISRYIPSELPRGPTPSAPPAIPSDLTSDVPSEPSLAAEELPAQPWTRDSIVRWAAAKAQTAMARQEKPPWEQISRR